MTSIAPAPEPTAELVEVRRLAGSTWRASDARFPEGHPYRIVADLQRVDGYVLVVWRGSGAGWAAFPHLPAALRAVRLTCLGRPVHALIA
ncbi:MAG TPA: hypothetical protein VIL55_01570 [Naasia sp.]|jgi:hypothetical protein